MRLIDQTYWTFFKWTRAKDFTGGKQMTFLSRSTFGYLPVSPRRCLLFYHEAVIFYCFGLKGTTRRRDKWAKWDLRTLRMIRHTSSDMGMRITLHEVLLARLILCVPDVKQSPPLMDISLIHISQSWGRIRKRLRYRWIDELSYAIRPQVGLNIRSRLSYILCQIKFTKTKFWSEVGSYEI